MVALLERTAVPGVESDYITLAHAVEIAGYSSKSTLYKAVREGRLKSVRIGPHTVVTKRLWLDEYLASIRQDMSHRGRSRAGDRAPDG